MSTADTMTSLLPVVVTAGVAMKMTDWLLQREQQMKPPARKKRKDVYSRRYSGDFSNVGW